MLELKGRKNNISTLMAINWNVNWRLIILRQVLNKGENMVRGGRNPLPYKNKSLRGLRLVIVLKKGNFIHLNHSTIVLK